MNLRTITAAAALSLTVLAGCKAPSVEPPNGATRAPSPCGTNFEPVEREPLPAEFAGIHPSHAVRFQVFTCHGGQWQGIGGVAHVFIGATSEPPAPGGAVKAGTNYPWPYDNIARPLPFQFPIQMGPGLISSHVLGVVAILLDPGDMVTCWVVTRDGREIPHSRGTAIIHEDESGPRLAEADCSAELIA